tara:strand:- start:442 stop:1017 length:576 start_codon:yes stop_codon:yes gene_type:complete
MELKDYIKVFDNTIEPEKIGSLIKYLNKVKFNPTAVLDREKGKVINKEIRNTDSWVFNDCSYSNAHWKNFLNHTLANVYHAYRENLDLKSQVNCKDITSIEALKYEEGGFFKIHHDHHYLAPRTLSMILFLNNDYEGGELIFDGPKKGTEKIETVLPAPGRVVVWPSTFLYPHSVEKVTKGTRYTVVSWLA